MTHRWYLVQYGFKGKYTVSVVLVIFHPFVKFFVAVFENIRIMEALSTVPDNYGLQNNIQHIVYTTEMRQELYNVIESHSITNTDNSYKVIYDAIR